MFMILMEYSHRVGNQEDHFFQWLKLITFCCLKPLENLTRSFLASWPNILWMLWSKSSISTRNVKRLYFLTFQTTRYVFFIQANWQYWIFKSSAVKLCISRPFQIVIWFLIFDYHNAFDSVFLFSYLIKIQSCGVNVYI